MSASDVIARLRELRANALNGDWFEEGHGIIAPDEATIVGSPWVAANVHWSSRPAIVAAMNSLDALLECAEAVQKIHDHLSDYIDARKTVDVSVAVAFETSRAALQALAEGGGE
jgi:hypothetical protein